MKNTRIIGIDFDNTIVSYDELFYKAALEKGLIPETIEKKKNSVRDYLREKAGNDTWTELQGVVYGTRMDEASFFPGVIDFLKTAKNRGYQVNIVSHKTKYPAIGPRVSLHQAARGWLKKNGFFDDPAFSIAESAAFFLETRELKIEKITNLNCAVFIDDLPEVFDNASFPGDIEKILFDPYNQFSNRSNLNKVDSWKKITETVFTG